MRIAPPCFPCLFRQLLRTSERVHRDKAFLMSLFEAFAREVPRIDLSKSPSHAGAILYRTIRKASGVEDPYKEAKEEGTRWALSQLPRLRSRVLSASDPLLAGVQAAAAGNVIDFGAQESFDAEKEVDSFLIQPVPEEGYSLFRRRLEEAAWVLYIGDNSGEAVFDRLLLEAMGKPAIFLTRARPIINDVTEEDAQRSGLQESARILSSGCDAPGLIVEEADEKVRRLFREAPLVISKGQGNFETLGEEKREIFFLFKVKCSVASNLLGVPVGSLVFGPSPG